MKKRYIKKKFNKGGGLGGAEQLDQYAAFGQFAGEAIDIADPPNDFGVRSTGAAIGAGAAKGAAAGAAFGPWGAAIGGVVGGVSGGVKNAANKKKQRRADEERRELTLRKAKSDSMATLADYDEFGQGDSFFALGGMLPKMKYVEGGNLNPISEDAVEVKADNPNAVDSVDIGEAYVDHNEVIDNENRVFSDNIKYGKGTIADEAKRLEKQKSANQRFSKANQRIEERLDSLFEYQQTLNGNSNGEEHQYGGVASPDVDIDSISRLSNEHMKATYGKRKKKEYKSGGKFRPITDPTPKNGAIDLFSLGFHKGGDLLGDTLDTPKYYQNGGEIGKPGKPGSKRNKTKRFIQSLPQEDQRYVFDNALTIRDPYFGEERMPYGELVKKLQSPEYASKFFKGRREYEGTASKKNIEDYLKSQFDRQLGNFYNYTEGSGNNLLDADILHELEARQREREAQTPSLGLPDKLKERLEESERRRTNRNKLVSDYNKQIDEEGATEGFLTDMHEEAEAEDPYYVNPITGQRVETPELGEETFRQTPRYSSAIDRDFIKYGDLSNKKNKWVTEDKLKGKGGFQYGGQIDGDPPIGEAELKQGIYNDFMMQKMAGNDSGFSGVVGTPPPIQLEGGTQPTNDSGLFTSENINKLGDFASTYGSDIYNLAASNRLPNVQRPNLESAVVLPKLHAKDQFAEIDRQTQGLKRGIKRNTAQASAANSAQMQATSNAISARNKAMGDVNRQNALIGAKQAGINSSIEGRNMERLNKELQDKAARRAKSLQLKSQSLANISEKMLQRRRERNQKELDRKRLELLGKPYEQSGIGKRNIDPVMQSYMDYLNKR